MILLGKILSQKVLSVIQSHALEVRQISTVVLFSSLMSQRGSLVSENSLIKHMCVLLSK